MPIKQIKTHLGGGLAITTDGDLINVNTNTTNTVLDVQGKGYAPHRPPQWHPVKRKVPPPGLHPETKCPPPVAGKVAVLQTHSNPSWETAGDNLLSIINGIGGCEAVSFDEDETYPWQSFKRFQQLWVLGAVITVSSFWESVCTQFLKCGRSVVLLGEWFAGTRNAWIVSYMNDTIGVSLSLRYTYAAMEFEQDYTSPRGDDFFQDAPHTLTSLWGWDGADISNQTSSLISERTQNTNWGTTMVLLPGDMADFPRGTLVVIFDTNVVTYITPHAHAARVDQQCENFVSVLASI